MTTEVLRYAAFTDDGRGGNPAGVVLDATALSAEDMLAVARDLGFSETAFLLPETSSTAAVRYFSPQAEVAFCGHATIATAVALAEREGPGTLELTTRAGPVTVRSEATPSGTTATLTSPPATSRPADPETVDRLLHALRWSHADLDPAYPVHIGNAGNDHPLVAVRTREALAALDYDYDGLAGLMAEQGWTTVHAFWAESPDRFHARDPFPPGGVVEDPATGSAAAAFGGYLRALHGTGAPRRVTILQGHDMGFPCRLVVDIDPGKQTLDVTGAAAPMDASAAGPRTARG